MTIARTGRGLSTKLLTLLLALIRRNRRRCRRVRVLPIQQMCAFYQVLLATMKNGRTLGQTGRYAALAPVVNNLFDMPFMAQLAVGPSWDTLSPAQQQQIVVAFGRYVSRYRRPLRQYSGEHIKLPARSPIAAGPSSRPASSKPARSR